MYVYIYIYWNVKLYRLLNIVYQYKIQQYINTQADFNKLIILNFTTLLLVTGGAVLTLGTFANTSS